MSESLSVGTSPQVATCPCCRFPTLSAGGAYEICLVCWWEDDGQGDRDADLVHGGPNGDYSLTVARANFLDHGHMYNPGEGNEVVERPSATRRAILEYLQSIRQDPSRADNARLRELVDAEDRHLRQGTAS